MTEVQDRQRGIQAAAILNDDVFQGAFRQVEEKSFSDWKITTDTEQREQLWLMMRLLDQLEATLGSAIANGEIATHELLRLNPDDSDYSKSLYSQI